MAGTLPILVVDDSLAYREMVTAILSRRGHRVSTAANGSEALARLRDMLEPHIVLLDIVMPILDGIGVLRAIATEPGLAEAGHSIIVMSSPPPPAEFGTLDISHWLAKPFTPSQLLASVEAARTTEN